jgi:cadherin 23
VIGNVVAYDADIGDFGHVTYLLDRRSSKVKCVDSSSSSFLRKVSRTIVLLQRLFSIDPESGAIIVMDRLDKEEQQSYTLVLEAWDNYKFGYAAGESRNAFQQVT